MFLLLSEVKAQPFAAKSFVTYAPDKLPAVIH